MKYLTLETLKQQLIIDTSFEDDDDLLESIGDAVEETVEQLIDKPLEDVVEDNNGALPAPLLHAMKMLAEYFYDNRGSNDNDIPNAFYFLCKLYRQFK
jgi:uncharacterized phage protein (predicted DNA packaging)